MVYLHGTSGSEQGRCRHYDNELWPNVARHKLWEEKHTVAREKTSLTHISAWPDRETPKLRICTECAGILPIDQFWRNVRPTPANPDPYHARCKHCMRRAFGKGPGVPRGPYHLRRTSFQRDPNWPYAPPGGSLRINGELVKPDESV